MSEVEKAFLRRLKQRYGTAGFAPSAAVEDFHLSELPEAVRDALVTRGPGYGATMVLTRWLAEQGAQCMPGTRTKHGKLWRLP